MGLASVLGIGSSLVKSSRRLTEGPGESRDGVLGGRMAGLDIDCGPIDRDRRGEEPRNVFAGERPMGGGIMVLALRVRRRVLRVSTGSGIEPGSRISR
jgi:hypothetical protein